MKRNIFSLLAVLIAFVTLSSCHKESSEKKILSFTITSPNVTATISEKEKTIRAMVPFGTDLTKLIPIITISDNASINPASGVTTDFTNPVTYTVTAEDGSRVNYTATVTIDASTGDPTNWTGNIDANTVWRDLGLPVDYIVEGPVSLLGNALLTIEPGVTIMFTGVDGGIEVGENAGLRMVGTAEKPIELVGPANNPNNGSWNRVIIYSNRNDNVFEHVHFLRGGSSNSKWDGVVNVRGKLSMKHCTIDGSLGTGLSTEYDGYLTAFEDNTIINCALYPWITENFPALCRGNNSNNIFYQNGDNRVYVDPSYVNLSMENLTLHTQPIPYYCPDGLSFDGNKELTIQPGVVIEIGSGHGISMGNECGYIVNGTAEKPIIFRCDNPADNWDGILFSSDNKDSSFSYCKFINCGNGEDWNNSCCLYIRSEARLNLSNNVFGPSNQHGVGIENIENWGRVTHQGNTFTGCAHGNVWIDGAGTYGGNDYQNNQILDELP